MFAFTPMERAGLIADHGLAVDPLGREVMAGLTFDETRELMTHRRTWPRQKVVGEAYARIRVLRETHEAARVNQLGAELARRKR